jgi:hypothetical protein
MSALPITKQSAWNNSEIELFLASQNTPMRIAVEDTELFPMICSVWHLYHDKVIYAVAHKNSKLIKKITAKPHCAFEIAPNEPPYKGVRGQANCIISEHDCSTKLHQLLDRFLGDGYEELRGFLSSRSDDERVIELHIHKITAWDFSKRMNQ